MHSAKPLDTKKVLQANIINAMGGMFMKKHE